MSSPRVVTNWRVGPAICPSTGVVTLWGLSSKAAQHAFLVLVHKLPSESNAPIDLLRRAVGQWQRIFGLWLRRGMGGLIEGDMDTLTTALREYFDVIVLENWHDCPGVLVQPPTIDNG